MRYSNETGPADGSLLALRLVPVLGEADRHLVVQIILDGNDRIMGADAIRAHSGEWIHLIALALRTEMSIRDSADTILAYPTFSEIVKKAFVRHLRTKS